MTSILVTGGAGYIGSHLLVALLKSGHSCISVDNYSNSSPASLQAVRKIVPGSLECIECDIRDSELLLRELRHKRIDGVIHAAGLKAVAESIQHPILYFDNNISGTRALLGVLDELGIGSDRDRQIPFVFSSSATVYGMQQAMPLTEDAIAAPQNPYGQTKLEIEQLLAFHAETKPGWRIANLRYFNPVGAHESGLIGEDPKGIPSNLMPVVCQVAAGRLKQLQVFGGDYSTPDGTAIRDYIHVMDLVEGHLAALSILATAHGGTVPNRVNRPLTINLGTGRGHSVLELVRTFERANNVKIPLEFAARRPGDVAQCYSDPSAAVRLLAWSARRNLTDMCRDAWQWQRKSPEGYRSQLASK